MQTRSDILARTSEVIRRAGENGIKSTGDVVAFWKEIFALGQELSQYAPTLGIRYEQSEFVPNTWKLFAKLCEPYMKAGCVERREGERRGRDGALILKPDLASEEVLASTVQPKRTYNKKPAKVETVTVIEKVVQRVCEKPKRKVGRDSCAVVIDLANVTKRRDANGRLVLPVNHINWNALRNVLQMHHGESVPLERLVLCVSAHYYADNRTALACAERAGFKVDTKYGEKEADPVVICQLMNVVMTAVVKNYLDRIPTVVLVSGDADFSGVLYELKEHARLEGLALPLHVVSWEDSLSRALDLNASKTTAIEDILKYIRLP